MSNESTSPQYVFFDNLDVAISESPILESSDYYPFGLTFNSYTKPGTVEQRWKFQGQEHISDLGLNWDQFKWRNADPALGRFFSVDPLADKYVYNSPYAFSENKVVAHVELEGLEAWEIKYMRTEEQKTNVIPKAHQENFQAGYKIVGGIIATVLSAGTASPWLMAAGITSGMFSAASGTAELVANNMEGGTFTAADVPDSYLGALGVGADKLAGNENNQIETAGNLVEGVLNLTTGATNTSTAGVVNTVLNTTTVISSGSAVVENIGGNGANSNTGSKPTNVQQNSITGPPVLEPPTPPILPDEL